MQGDSIKEAESLSEATTDNEKQDAGPSQITTATDWDGPDDPDNPHSWPLWLRVYHVTAPALFGFSVYVLSDDIQNSSLTRLQYFWHIGIHISLCRHYG